MAEFAQYLRFKDTMEARLSDKYGNLLAIFRKKKLPENKIKPFFDGVIDFADSFEKVLDAGAIFDCYIEKDGRESWYDRDFGIENMDKGWAREYLTNIREV